VGDHRPGVAASTTLCVGGLERDVRRHVASDKTRASAKHIMTAPGGSAWQTDSAFGVATRRPGRLLAPVHIASPEPVTGLRWRCLPAPIICARVTVWGQDAPAESERPPLAYGAKPRRLQRAIMCARRAHWRPPRSRELLRPVTSRVPLKSLSLRVLDRVDMMERAFTFVSFHGKGPRPRGAAGPAGGQDARRCRPDQRPDERVRQQSVHRTSRTSPSGWVSSSI
jgi:hypothetical protein